MDDTETRSIDGVIFDLDGTLVDSERLHAEAWTTLLRAHGCFPPADVWPDAIIGISEAHTLKTVLGMFPALHDAGDLLKAKLELYRELLAKNGGEFPMPGVHTRLRQLNAAGIPMAVGTNSVLANCRAALQAAGMLHYFQTMVTFDQVENGKPAPDIFQLAAERLGCPPERCAVIEDSLPGILAGRAAGCLVIGIETTMSADKLREANPDYIMPDTATALDWLEDLLVRQRERSRQ